MNKGLEATKRLKWGYAITREERINLCECIEKELKRLEQLEIMYSNSVIEGAKQKKALEIIKNKGVFVHLLQQSQNVEEYNSLMLIAFKKMAERDYKGAVEKFCLTQEEFNLLKEVML